MKYPYRVFLCYARDDNGLRHRVSDVLNEFGFASVSDDGILPGRPFPDEIRTLISQAHVFVPIVTSDSKDRAWVNQEIGYALALAIPILALSVDGALPGGLIENVQSITTGSDLEGLRNALGQGALELAIKPQALPQRPIEVVEWAEQRSQRIAEYADELWERGNCCHVCHRALVTTFSIPDQDDFYHPDWEACGPVFGTPYLREILLKERRALERHVRKAGCWLIVNTAMPLDETFVGSRPRRLKILQEFLESMPDELIDVTFMHSPATGSVLVVGDSFLASSHAPRTGGYRQSVIVWHAPAVLREREDFERQMITGLRSSGLERGKSRKAAIDRLHLEIAGKAASA